MVTAFQLACWTTLASLLHIEVFVREDAWDLVTGQSFANIGEVYYSTTMVLVFIMLF